jgi:predicted transport protein
MYIKKNQIKIWVSAKWGLIDDAKGIARNVADIGHWGTGDYEIQVTDDNDLEYIMSLIKQVL